MNVSIKLLLLISVLFILAGCLGNTGSEPILIIDPVGTSHLYINNQTSVDLSVSYKMTDNHTGRDSTVAISAASVTRILSAGGFSPPSPSEALTNLSFYNSSGEIESPIFMIEPIINEDWNSTVIEVDEGSYYSEIKFELVITGEDIK